MARRTPDPATPAKQGRFAQFRAVFTMTRRQDPSLVWWMVLAVVGSIAAGAGVGVFVGHPVYVAFLGLLFGVLIALVILARKAERAAYAQIAGQPGATGAALQGLRRGWNVEQQPIAVDPRTQDLIFRAVGRPGVVLVTEGPLPRVNRLAEAERKRVTRVLPGVQIHVIHAGDGADQVPLPKLARSVMKLKATMSKTEVSEVARRLRALGAARPPIPKGIDPLRMRPDRKAMRGR